MHRPRFLARKAKRSSGIKLAGVLAVAGLLTALGSATGAVASGQPGKVSGWQQAIAKLKLPGKGCFTAAYPKVKWIRTACKAAPKRPYPPAHGPRPTTVGNGNDYTAGAVTGNFQSVTGSFDFVSPGITETGQQDGSGPQIPNTYSLQVNTNHFMVSQCTASPNRGCRGWQQFIFSTTGRGVFLEYWLLAFNAACPAGWSTFRYPDSPDIDCFKNTPIGPLTGPIPAATNLGGVKLTASAAAGGSDSVVLTGPAGHAAATKTAADSVFDLASAWTNAEFAVVGDCCNSRANFSPGAILQVRTTTHNGTRMAPTCNYGGLTGETNNLNLSGTPAIGIGPSPALVTIQTASSGTPGCATADGHADTHLDNFRHFSYDFQGVGDYELASTGPNFDVQTRQVPDPPSWPNNAINTAVATHIGKSDVAVCLAPPNPPGSPSARLFINHKSVSLAPGSRRNLSDGGEVSLDGAGSTYLIRDASGNSVRAQIIPDPANQNYINVFVGLGRWPEAVHGLLGNAGTDGTALVSRDGAIFRAPFPFDSFYAKYGDSWRVPAKDSLLSDCGQKVATGNPTNVLYVANLDPKLAQAAKTTCVHAGVKAQALIDDCTLDVAVLGTKAATQIYLHLPTDLTVGLISPPQNNSAAPRP